MINCMGCYSYSYSCSFFWWFVFWKCNRINTEIGKKQKERRMLGICCCRCCFFSLSFFYFSFLVYYSLLATQDPFFWSLKQQTTNGVTNLCIRKKTAYRRQSLDNANTTSLDMNLQGRETKRVINVYISILNSRGHCKSYSSSSFFMQERQILVCFFFFFKRRQLHDMVSALLAGLSTIMVDQF